MKRNTTAPLCVCIEESKENIQEIEFVFKNKRSETAKNLLYKKYTQDTMKVLEGSVVGETLLIIDFTVEETLKLPEGTIFMDTRITTPDGKILETSIADFDMADTLFAEVIK